MCKFRNTLYPLRTILCEQDSIQNMQNCYERSQAHALQFRSSRNKKKSTCILLKTSHLDEFGNFLHFHSKNTSTTPCHIPWIQRYSFLKLNECCKIWKLASPSLVQWFSGKKIPNRSTFAKQQHQQSMTISGYLKVKGTWGSFSKYWFVLAEHTLYRYRSAKETSVALETLDLQSKHVNILSAEGITYDRSNIFLTCILEENSTRLASSLRVKVQSCCMLPLAMNIPCGWSTCRHHANRIPSSKMPLWT